MHNNKTILLHIPVKLTFRIIHFYHNLCITILYHPIWITDTMPEISGVDAGRIFYMRGTQRNIDGDWWGSTSMAASGRDGGVIWYWTLHIFVAFGTLIQGSCTFTSRFIYSGVPILHLGGGDYLLSFISPPPSAFYTLMLILNIKMNLLAQDVSFTLIIKILEAYGGLFLPTQKIYLDINNKI